MIGSAGTMPSRHCRRRCAHPPTVVVGSRRAHAPSTVARALNDRCQRTPQARTKKAVAELTAVSAEPFDFAVAVAKGSLASTASNSKERLIRAVMFEALTAWRDPDRRSRRRSRQRSRETRLMSATRCSPRINPTSARENGRISDYRGARRSSFWHPRCRSYLLMADIEASADQAIPGVEACFSRRRAEGAPATRTVKSGVSVRMLSSSGGI